MAVVRAFSTIQLVNGSIGDPVLYLDYPGSDNAILFDGGENCALTKQQLADLEAVFVTHHHIDHFIGLDRIVRANLDTDKTLHIYGPVNTIRKVYDRVKSYEHPFFPFMQLVMEIHELNGTTETIGRIECKKKFAPPELETRPWAGPVCYENEHLQVEAVAVEHTVPCLAFALVERTGFHPDPEKLAKGMLRNGPWIQETLRLLRNEAPATTMLDIQAGRFPLSALAEQYFTKSEGARVAYITDTFWAESIRADLVKLARGAWRLYCDSFYAKAQTKEANKHKHMQAPQSGELAKTAKVEQLVLIHFSSRYVGKYEMLIEEAGTVFPRVTAELTEGECKK